MANLFVRPSDATRRIPAYPSPHSLATSSSREHVHDELIEPRVAQRPTEPTEEPHELVAPAGREPHALRHLPSALPPLPSPPADVPALPRLDAQEQCQRVEEHLCKVMEISCDVEELILLSRKLYYKMLLSFPLPLRILYLLLLAAAPAPTSGAEWARTEAQTRGRGHVAL